MISILIAHYRHSPVSEVADFATQFKYRPVEARLYGMAYAPLPVFRGGTFAPTTPGSARGALGELLRQPEIVREPRARGEALLLAGETEAAVAVLNAASQNSYDPALLTDLAAARYEQARRLDSPQLFAEALAAAHRALLVEPSSRPALFNRALALDALMITPLAAAAYNDYLKTDATSGWATEARRRRDAFPAINRVQEWNSRRPDLERACAGGRTGDVEEIVRAFPEDARKWGEGPYLSDWADAILAGRNGAVALDNARCIGTALRRTSGEMLLYEAVATIDTSPEPVRIAKAHSVYRQGRIAYSEHRYRQALLSLQDAASAFSRCASPMELIASYYKANVLVDVGRAAEALLLVDDVDGNSRRNYIALHAQLQWARSLAYGRLGHVYETLQAATDSAATFDRLGERNSACRTRTTVAAILTLIGRIDEAWSIRREVLAAASASGKSGNLDATLANAIRDELHESHFDVAAALATEAAAVATSDIAKSEALLWKAFCRAHETPAETYDFAPAVAAAASIRDADDRAQVMDEISFANAHVLVESAPEEAVRLLDSCVAYREKYFSFTSLEARVARASALHALGRNDLASSDLDHVLTVIEEQRRGFTDPLSRDGYGGNAVNAYEAAIELAADTGDYERALAISERSRARLLDQRDIVTTSKEIAARLPADTLFVYYATTTRSTVTIAISRSAVRAVRLNASRASISQMRQGLADLVRRDDPRWKEAARELFQTIAGPIEPELRNATSLVVAADEAITGVPIAALIDPATGRFVIQDHTVSITPSASAWLARHALTESRSPRALLVGDPAFNHQLFPNLPRLPAAREEIRALSELYRNRHELIDADATPHSVIASLADADVVHIAAHTIASDADAASSVIILAPSQSNAGLLYAFDIARLHLARAPVIFLAGCGTAAVSPGHGSIRTIAAAFLAAGSRAVIGTHWDVDDAHAKNIATNFHRALSSGESPADALRAAQLAVLADPASHARDWVAFQSFTTR